MRFKESNDNSYNKAFIREVDAFTKLKETFVWKDLIPEVKHVLVDKKAVINQHLVL